MSATNSDSSADWRSSNWDGKSEQRSNSGGKIREAIPTSSLLAPQPTAAADAARRATGCQGVHRNCATMWEPTAGLCKKQQAESTNPQNALKRRCSAVEEEEEQEKRRPHQRVPESESDRAFSRKVSASLRFFVTVICSSPLVSLQHSVKRDASSKGESTRSRPVNWISHVLPFKEAFVSQS